MGIGDPLVFAVVFAALYAAHEVGDHWVQTHHQACGKDARDRRGRLLCGLHVASLTATKAVALLLVVVVTGVHLAPWAVGVGLAVDAASHYWADRRFTLQALAARVGKGGFAQLGDPAAAPVGVGSYALDQSWHVGWLFIAALILSIGGAA
ncbi:transcriptional regulator [Spirillospora sp. CA-108201]